MRRLLTSLIAFILIVLVAIEISSLVNRHAPFEPPFPIPGATSHLLITYDADNTAKLPDNGDLIDSGPFRAWCEQHHVDWRIVPAGTAFGDDMPDFKKLNAEPRASDNWLYLDRGKLSQPLPANEDEAEKIIGKYVK